MIDTRRIAYFHIFGGPPIERSVGRMLADAFPEYEVEPIQLLDLVRASPRVVLRNALATARRAPGRWPTSLRELKRLFIRTPYLFRAVRQLANRRLTESMAADPSRYVFSFQLQSLFDTSLDGLPHFVYTDHTHLANLQYPDFDPGDLNEPEWIDCERTVYARATRVFTRSSNITASLIDDYGCAPDRLACVGVGINTPDPQQRSAPGRAKRVLFVGTDWARKGGPALVEAFARVQRRHPDATLEIVGCRPELSLPNCRALGRLPVDELGARYAQADLFCLPTTNEPFGVVIIEAMAHGLPIVATRVGAIPDLVTAGHNGELVEPGDVDSLSETLERLLDDPARLQRYGENSAAVVASTYNWPRVAAAIRKEILEDIG